MYSSNFGSLVCMGIEHVLTIQHVRAMAAHAPLSNQPQKLHNVYKRVAVFDDRTAFYHCNSLCDWTGHVD